MELTSNILVNSSFAFLCLKRLSSASTFFLCIKYCNGQVKTCQNNQEEIGDNQSFGTESKLVKDTNYQKLTSLNVCFLSPRVFRAPYLLSLIMARIA